MWSGMRKEPTIHTVLTKSSIRVSTEPFDNAPHLCPHAPKVTPRIWTRPDATPTQRALPPSPATSTFDTGNL